MPEAVAKDFVLRNHYSASYVAASKRYGLYEGQNLVGVAVLSVPAQVRVLTSVFPDLVPYGESLELGRFVLADEVPANAESWFLARCWELAAADGLRGIVSFSDPVARFSDRGGIIFPGHVGTIYQASNALYLGRGTPRNLKVLPDGSVLNERALQKVRSSDSGREYVERQLVAFGARPRREKERGGPWLKSALASARVRSLAHAGNHRYGFRIGNSRNRVRVGLPTAVYPKRVSSR